MKKQAMPRPYHHGDLKAALVGAVLALVREKGPRGFSLNEASRVAGVSAGAPYRHFRDKEALLAEVTVEGNVLLEKELRKAAAGKTTSRERLVAVFLAYIRFAKRHPDYFAVMFGSGIKKEKFPRVQETGRQAFQVGAELAARMETDGEKALELALAVWTMAHGFAALQAEGALGVMTGSANNLRLAERLLRERLG